MTVKIVEIQPTMWSCCWCSYCWGFVKAIPDLTWEGGSNCAETEELCGQATLSLLLEICFVQAVILMAAVEKPEYLQ